MATVKLYLKVSADKYRIIEAMATSADQLAEIVGVDRTTVYRGVNHWMDGKKSSFETIDIDDDIDYSIFTKQETKKAKESHYNKSYYQQHKNEICKRQRENYERKKAITCAR